MICKPIMDHSLFVIVVVEVSCILLFASCRRLVEDRALITWSEGCDEYSVTSGQFPQVWYIDYTFVSSLSECRATCSAHTDCGGFYVTNTTDPDNSPYKCWMRNINDRIITRYFPNSWYKNSTLGITWYSKDCTASVGDSVSPDCQDYTSYQYPNTQITDPFGKWSIPVDTLDINDLTPQQCQQYCNLYTECRSVRYLYTNTGRYGWCYLKTVALSGLIGTEYKENIVQRNIPPTSVLVTYDRYCSNGTAYRALSSPTAGHSVTSMTTPVSSTAAASVPTQPAPMIQYSKDCDEYDISTGRAATPLSMQDYPNADRSQCRTLCSASTECGGFTYSTIFGCILQNVNDAVISDYLNQNWYSNGTTLTWYSKKCQYDLGNSDMSCNDFTKVYPNKFLRYNKYDITLSGGVFKLTPEQCHQFCTLYTMCMSVRYVFDLDSQEGACALYNTTIPRLIARGQGDDVWDFVDDPNDDYYTIYMTYDRYCGPDTPYTPSSSLGSSTDSSRTTMTSSSATTANIFNSETTTMKSASRTLSLSRNYIGLFYVSFLLIIFLVFIEK